MNHFYCCSEFVQHSTRIQATRFCCRILSEAHFSRWPRRRHPILSTL